MIDHHLEKKKLQDHLMIIKINMMKRMKMKRVLLEEVVVEEEAAVEEAEAQVEGAIMIRRVKI